MLEILVLIFAILLAAGVLLFVLEPVWRATFPPTEEETGEYMDVLADLYARRDALYASIKELEFDHRVGKIGAEDYERFSARLKQEAADVLRQIEEVKAAQRSVRERLEAQVRAMMGPTRAPKPAPAGTATAGPAATVAGEPRYCTQCGHPLVSGARFCSQCGAPVRRPPSA